ncbi:MAG: hypothetical protein WCL50_16315, partial [Spirochaetota bacterium]
MKRSILAIALGLLAILEAFGAGDSLMARILVSPLYDESADPALTATGRVVTDTIALTLRLMGSYRVDGPAGVETIRDMAGAKAAAEAAKVDSLVLGSVTRDIAGVLTFNVKLFDRQKSDFTIVQTAKAESVLDVFDAADALTRGFLESLAGTHLGFGSIELVNGGEPGEYEALIDGLGVGENPGTIPRLLNGKHFVVLHQVRLFGGLDLLAREVDVVEDQVTRVDFAVPYLTAAERAKIGGLLEIAKKGASDFSQAGQIAATGALGELDGILSKVDWSPNLAELKATVDLVRSLIAARR